MWILDLFKVKPKAVGFRMRIRLPTLILRKGVCGMLTLTDNQEVVLSVVGEDAKGNPAPLPVEPVWAVGGANPGIITLTPAADGMSATVVATGGLGTAQVTVSDAIAAGDTIQGILDVTVVGDVATQIVINAGTPTEQS